MQTQEDIIAWLSFVVIGLLVFVIFLIFKCYDCYLDLEYQKGQTKYYEEKADKYWNQYFELKKKIRNLGQ